MFNFRDDRRFSFNSVQIIKFSGRLRSKFVEIHLSDSFNAISRCRELRQLLSTFITYLSQSHSVYMSFMSVSCVTLSLSLSFIYTYVCFISLFFYLYVVLIICLCNSLSLLISLPICLRVCVCLSVSLVVSLSVSV